MFCVECGKEGDLIRGLCSECFLLKNVFITFSDHIDVEVCNYCGARKKKRGWISTEEQNLIEEIVNESAICNKDVTDFDIHITPKYEDEGNINVSVITHANALGLKAQEEHETRIRIKKSICEECSKQQGGYWEAKVQLRGSKRGLEEEDFERAINIVDLVTSEREKKDKGAFITKIEKKHDGLDFYFGSKNLGKMASKKLANEFGGVVKESHKLIGRKKGKDVFRTTYAVHTLDYRVGDFINLGDKVYLVLGLSSNKLNLRVLDSQRKVFLKPRELERAKLLGGNEIMKDMVVVSKSENEIQVLDPDTLKTVDVVLPKDYEVTKESVKIVKSEYGFFLVEED